MQIPICKDTERTVTGEKIPVCSAKDAEELLEDIEHRPYEDFRYIISVLPMHWLRVLDDNLSHASLKISLALTSDELSYRDREELKRMAGIVKSYRADAGLERLRRTQPYKRDAGGCYNSLPERFNNL